MAADKPKKPSQFMDVSKPGKSTPTASSRPIIVGHKPEVRDPMVTEESDVSAQEQVIDVKRTAPKVITPLESESQQQDDNNPTSPDSSSVTAVDDTPKEAPLVDEAPESVTPASLDSNVPSKEPKKEKDSNDKGSSVINAVVGQATKNKDKKTDKKIDELEKRQAEIEKLIEDKKYFVHTTQVTKKQRKTRWIALLILLIIAIGAYLAIDAQVVKNNYKLPYEFFKDQEIDMDSNLPVVEAPSTDRGAKEQPAENGTFTGEEIESVNKKFSIKIPDGWRMLLITESDSLYPEDVNTPDSLEYKPGDRPVITRQPSLGTDAPVRFSVNYLESHIENGFLNDDSTKTAITLDDGTKGTRYYRQEPLQDVEGLGAYPGEKQYVYEFEAKDGGKIVVVYRILEKNKYDFANQLEKSDPNRLEFIEEVIKTLKIN